MTWKSKREAQRRANIQAQQNGECLVLAMRRESGAWDYFVVPEQDTDKPLWDTMTAVWSTHLGYLVAEPPFSTWF